MVLCDMCKSEAEVTIYRHSFWNGFQKETVGGERIESNPPHGMDWGETCDRCQVTAAVTIE